MKKTFSVILVIVATLTCMGAFGFALARADDGYTPQAKAAYLVDYDSDTVIYEKNSSMKLPIASMTKIMLLNLCFEKLDEGEFSLDEQITISKTASGMGGSQVFLEANSQYKASDLLKSIIVASANDASVAMAERLYGSELSCVEAMNNKRDEWGLKDTLFSNCTGLTKPTQYSSARDVAIMLKKLVSHDEYFDFSTIWTDKINHGDHETEIANTNKLIRFYEGCDGGKTGFTSESGFCLAATAKRGNTRIISVVINAESGKSRFADVSNGFDYAFNNYSSKTVVDDGVPLNITATIGKGVKKQLKIRAEESAYVFSERNKKENIIVDFKPKDALKAPVKKGDRVGELIIYRDNVEYKRVAVVADEDVSAKTYFDYVRDVAANWGF